MPDFTKVDAMATFPNFFILGAPKCGTTTLYKWLGDHPQVFAPHKETCYFSQDIFPTESLRTHIPTLEEYLEIFKTDDPEVLASGEATPKYLYSDAALHSIKSLFPEAKLIICLRDPIDISISWFNQKVKEGVESEQSFEQAWKKSLDSNFQSGDSRERDYHFWACIGTRLEKVFELFPRDQVQVIFLDQLKNDPQNVYRKILKFLNLEDDGRATFEAENVRFRMRNVRLQYSIRKLRELSYPLLEPIRKAFRLKGFGLIRLVNRFNTVSGEYHSPVDEAFRETLYSDLADEIQLAENFLEGGCLIQNSTLRK